MKTIDYLNHQLALGFTTQGALEKLKCIYGINYSLHKPTGLYVLNYDQFRSVFSHIITKECRSLVVECAHGEFKVVSRSFNRFYGYGEPAAEHTGDNISDLCFYEKLDGSLITVFHYNGEWMYRTTSMIMPVDILIDGIRNSTWKDLIETGLGWSGMNFQNFHTDCSYMFELTSPVNKVVVDYDETKATLLSVRKIDGEYKNIGYIINFAIRNSIHMAKEYSFNNLDDMISKAKELENLGEGFVAYRDCVPILKIKNPAYTAAFHLRGEGLNHGRIMNLLISGEIDEYLASFPTDKKIIQPYIDAYNSIINQADYVYSSNESIDDQREFYDKVSMYGSRAIILSMRNKGYTSEVAFDKLLNSYKKELIEQFLEE